MKNKKIIIILIIFALLLIVGFIYFLNFSKSNTDLSIQDDSAAFYGAIRSDKVIGIKSYLLSQKYFSPKTRENSHSFCDIRNLGDEKKWETYLGFPTYEWVHCSEYVLNNNEIVEISGISVPVKIGYPEYGVSNFDLNLFTYEVPRDGSYYTEDIERIFPKEIQSNILKIQKNNKLINSVKEEAIKWFAFQKNTLNETKYQDPEDNEIAIVSMSENGEEITLNFKDFKNIVLKRTIGPFPDKITYKNLEKNIMVIYYEYENTNWIQIVINDDYNTDFGGKIMKN